MEHGLNVAFDVNTAGNKLLISKHFLLQQHHSLHSMVGGVFNSWY